MSNPRRGAPSPVPVVYVEDGGVVEADGGGGHVQAGPRIGVGDRRRHVRQAVSVEVADGNGPGAIADGDVRADGERAVAAAQQPPDAVGVSVE
ncbi:MAG TPA: hypothetical protein VF624_05130 [Tepidisphaeraceae bacterium]|jgi:hypothetical protein